MNEEPKRRRRLRIVVIAAILLLLVYVVSPYFSLWRFSAALNSGDGRRLESFVDFNAVRISLKAQLRGKLPPADPTQKPDLFAGLIERFAPALIDQLVDAFITPDGLAALITNPEIAQDAAAKDPNAIARAGSADRHFDRSDIRYAFFTGLREFLVDVKGTKLRFRFSRFRWILTDVELRLDEAKS